jgi:hypothetical protein
VGGQARRQPAILRLWPAAGVSFVPSLVLVGVFAVAVVVVAVAGFGRRTREIAVIATTCVYLVHILVSFVMYVATIVMPVDQWTVRTDSVVLILTIAISIAFPFVELVGVVMSLDWRGGRGFRHQPAGEATQRMAG